jgi:hypothetical protein
MHRPSIRMIVLAGLLLGCAGMYVGCSNDALPVTPSAPFLLDQMIINKDITPAPLTTLTRGAHYTARFDVSYTLSQASLDYVLANNLKVDVAAYTLHGGSVTILGSAPAFTIASASAVFHDSVAFTVPATTDTVYMEAYVLTPGGGEAIPSTVSWYAH